MSHALRVQYNQYLQMHHVPDNNRTIAHFLTFRMESEMRARENTQTGRDSSGRKRGLVHEHAFQDAEEPEIIEVEPELPPQQYNTFKKNYSPCPCCQQTTHKLNHCEVFYSMSPTERRTFASNQSLCYICMETGHQSGGCPNKTARCGICGQRHHFLLHPSAHKTQMHAEADEQDLIDFQVRDTQHLSCGYQLAKEGSKELALDVALTVATVWLTNPTNGKRLKVNLLADTGANTSCLDSTLGKELGLTGDKQPYHVQVGGGQVHSYSSFEAQVQIQGVQKDAKKHDIKFHVYDQPCGRLGPIDWSQAKKQWRHLSNLDLPQAANRHIQGIVGTTDFMLLSPQGPAITQGRYDPVAFLSPLGWLIGGHIRPHTSAVSNLHVLFMNRGGECCQETRSALERLWRVEPLQQNIESSAKLTPMEARAAKIFQDTYKQRPDGRYEVGLLWKEHVYLPRNYQSALDAFYKLERQMDRHPEMRRQFVNTISDWLNKEIASYVSPSHSEILYVIPTFMVIRLDKTTTSYRLVVDGARRFKGTCINDKLLAGPKLIQNLFDVLIRFRQGNYAFTCDIGSMFLNVKVPENDQRYLCIFYRETSSHPLQVVRLSSHPFGLASSPYVAMRVVQQHADTQKTLYPLAYRAVQNGVLVDDFVLSHDNWRLLKSTREQLQQLLSQIGMSVHKMAASMESILDDVPIEKIAKAKGLGEEEITDTPNLMPTIKTLGIVWNAQQDTLAIQYLPKHLQGPLTLRQVVSDGGRLYDPLGLALPIAMSNRILLQLCWSQGRHWDEALPEDLQFKWHEWSRRAQSIAEINIPRCIKSTNRIASKQRLIIFVDASAEAQAAVAYIQTLDTLGQRTGQLLAAKGKVTSLRKQESIPRLECQAAAMGAELGAKLNSLLGWPPTDTLYFSDSTTTLWWLRTHKPLKVFVANRICQILDVSEVRQWKYIHTKDNPADLPTRTCSVKSWAKNALWWWGPKFLTLPDDQWPEQPAVVATTEGDFEIRAQENILQKIHQQVQVPAPSPGQVGLRRLWGRYESAQKGLRITALVRHAASAWRTFKRNLPRKPLNYHDMENVVINTLIKEDQSMHLPSCVRAARLGIDSPPPYACWRTFLDDEGLLRINGRLQFSKTLASGTRNPVLLSSQMPMANELLRLIHERLKHAGGPNQLLSTLRETYWIHRGLPKAKAVIKNCAWCQARNSRELVRRTAPLHYSRENAPVGRAFHSIGIDMFGPMEVTQGRGKKRGKRYGLIFTCGFSRAINVEVMRDATADSCLLAFKRHVAIYGQPAHINSDQGTNLLYVRKVLDELQTVWEDAQPLLQHHFPRIKWTVNPPYSPSYGGHYESLIKVLKNTFKHTARWPRYLFNDEQLLTGLKEAAAIANMRPLTHTSSDPHDPPPLKPSDFLHAEILGTVPDWRSHTLHRRIKDELGEFQQELWSRMRTEVLSGLQKLKDWKSRNSLEVDDLVLFNNNEWRPDFWPLGRVTELLRHPDGETRTVKVRMFDGKIKESTHSTRNLYKIVLPKATEQDRLQLPSPTHDEKDVEDQPDQLQVQPPDPDEKDIVES